MKQLKFLSKLPDDDRAELAQELKSLTDGQTTKITLNLSFAVKTAYKLSWSENDRAYPHNLLRSVDSRTFASSVRLSGSRVVFA